jgi:hypothetical protein
LSLSVGRFGGDTHCFAQPCFLVSWPSLPPAQRGDDPKADLTGLDDFRPRASLGGPHRQGPCSIQAVWRYELLAHSCCGQVIQRGRSLIVPGTRPFGSLPKSVRAMHQGKYNIARSLRSLDRVGCETDGRLQVSGMVVAREPYKMERTQVPFPGRAIDICRGRLANDLGHPVDRELEVAVVRLRTDLATKPGGVASRQSCAIRRLRWIEARGLFGVMYRLIELCGGAGVVVLFG